MTPALRSARDHWRSFWSAPDPLLLEAGAVGELIIARIRLATIGLLLLIPVVRIVMTGSAPANLLGLLITLTAFAAASLVFQIVRRRQYQAWLGIATGVFDVSLVSLALTTYFVIGEPIVTSNSRVIFEVYFLAIAATALRYDARTCVVAGGLAVVQYGTITLVAAYGFDLAAPGREPNVDYGSFNWPSQLDRLILLGAATVIATAVVARTQRWLHRSASDHLTGLLNRGFFDERLEEEGFRALRYRRPFAVAMVDIDHFKRFNDAHGHSAGDEALKLVATRLSHGLRRSDVVARYGGEEFAIVLPETDLAAAVRKAEDLRQLVETAALSLRRDGGGSARITVSAGVAAWPTDGATAREILERADQRLYRAKQRGRNRVVGGEREEGDVREWSGDWGE